MPALGCSPRRLSISCSTSPWVGRLGAVALAGTGHRWVDPVPAVLPADVLSYGTTARAARFFGAGRRASAVGEGVQATWLAVALGTVVIAVVQAAAVPILTLIADGGEIADRRCRGFGSPSSGRPRS